MPVLPIIGLVVALAIAGLTTALIIAFAVLAIIGVGIGLIAYALYLNAAPNGISLPKQIPHLEYWALGIGGSLIILILGIELFWGLGVFYDRTYMNNLSGSHVFWYGAWYVLGHIGFGIGFLAGFFYLVIEWDTIQSRPEWEAGAAGSIMEPPDSKKVPYYVAYIGTATGLVFYFVQWPRIMTFLLIVLGFPFALYVAVRSGNKQQKITAHRIKTADEQTARDASTLAYQKQVDEELAAISEKDFLKNVIP